MSGRVHMYRTCANTGCASKKDKTLEECNYYGDPLHHITRVEGREVATCSVCGDANYFRDPDNINTRYPYYNASVDVTFKDKGQEQAFVKQNKLVAIGTPK